MPTMSVTATFSVGNEPKNPASPKPKIPPSPPPANSPCHQVSRRCRRSPPWASTSARQRAEEAGIAVGVHATGCVGRPVALAIRRAVMPTMAATGDAESGEPSGPVAPRHRLGDDLRPADAPQRPVSTDQPVADGRRGGGRRGLDTEHARGSGTDDEASRKHATCGARRVPKVSVVVGV